MHKYLMLFSAFALFVSTSCSSPTPTVAQPAAPSTPRFVISLRSVAQPDNYWSIIAQGAAEKAKELGVELVTANADDAQAQVQQLEKELANGASGLAVAPIDAKLLAPLQQKAEAAKIPFVMIESDGNLQHVNYVGTDEDAAGRLAADYICNPENSLIARNTEAAIISGAATDPVSKARATGGRWGLEDCLLKVVEEQNANSDPALAQSIATDILNKHPNVKILLVTDDLMAVGAVQAAKAIGRAGDVVIVSFGTNSATLDEIIDGNITATVAQNPDVIGSRAVESLYMLMDEESIPEHYDTGTRLVTIQNASQFR